MKHFENIIILPLCLLLSLPASAVEFRLLQVPDGDHLPIEAGVWYPSDASVPDSANTVFGQALSIDAPLRGKGLAVIALSHGYGGWYAGHADTALALAEAGFVVVAPTHTGNTWSDMSSPIEKWILDRPRHVRRAFEHLTQTAPFRTRVDDSRYGVYGFSAGGLTALLLLGGVPDFDLAAAHCRQYPDEFVCAEGMLRQLLGAGMARVPAHVWGADKRIAAAAIAAPGLGFAFSRESLAGVRAAVQLWSGGRDERVPTDRNAGRIASRLPVPAKTHWEADANHFAFMLVQCRPAFEENDPEDYAAVCGDAPGFDRFAFHRHINREMLRFFRENLSPDRVF